MSGGMKVGRAAHRVAWGALIAALVGGTAVGGGTIAAFLLALT